MMENKAMKTLSAAATILLPLSLVASVMGMNVMVRKKERKGEKTEKEDLYHPHR